MTSTVVVGYDQTPSSERALYEAAAEAERRGAALTVVHAADSDHADAAPRIADHGADLARTRHPGLVVHPVTLDDSPAAALVDQARDAELLVVGHRGRGGFARLLLGSTAMRAASHATCPTMVVRGTASGGRGVVLAAVALGEPAEEILDFACPEAVHRGARLTVISAWEMFWPPPYAGDNGQLRQASERAADAAKGALDRLIGPRRAGFPVLLIEGELVDGAPSAALTTATGHADLIVIGARGRGHGHGQGMHIGPVAHTLLRHADCPVVLVPRD